MENDLQICFISQSKIVSDNTMSQEQSIKNRENLRPYKQAIARYLRSSMALKGLKYDDLSALLAQKSVIITPDNLRSKVSKGMFSADLLIAIAEVLEVDDNPLPKILDLVRAEKTDQFEQI